MKHLLFYSLILSRLDRSPAARRYIVYSALMGAVFGALQFGEIIARKSMNASTLMVTFVTMLMPVAALTSLWWAKLIEGRDQRKLLIVIGSFSYIALASGAMLYSIRHLLGIHFIYFLSFALFGPSENRILQQHVASSKTGRTFGLATSIRMAVIAVYAGGAGLWMEKVEGGFRNVYPVTALIGFAGMLIFATIRTGGSLSGQPMPLNRHIFFGPLRDVVKLLKRRKDYLRFEAAFMVYGIAFMMTLPVVPLFLVDDLQLGYAAIGLARSTVPQVVMLVCIPIFGWIFDRSTPHRLAAIIFALLALYPLILISATYLEEPYRLAAVYTAFGYFGIVMSGVMVLWSLSSIRFSGDEDAGIYHSVHVAFTGIRGSFAPLLGLGVMSLMSKNAALLTSCCLFLVASGMMIMMRKIDAKHGENPSLRI